MKFNEFVKRLQSTLNSLGSRLTVDGVLGPITQAEVEKYDLTALAFAPLAVDPTPPPIGGQDPDEGTPPWYIRAFKACAIDPGKDTQVKNACALVERGMPQYRRVAERLGAVDVENFAQILGAIHFKEASCDFRGVLHNGERIIGTGKKTTIVPIGRGPFTSWEDAAIDAIGIESKRWGNLIKGGRAIGDILWALERYNGTGYISGAGRAETSPYLWACSNINDDKGKYVSDGKFDPNASTQSTVGAAVILKQFWLQGKFKADV